MKLKLFLTSPWCFLWLSWEAGTPERLGQSRIFLGVRDCLWEKFCPQALLGRGDKREHILESWSQLGQR